MVRSPAFRSFVACSSERPSDALITPPWGPADTLRAWRRIGCMAQNRMVQPLVSPQQTVPLTTSPLGFLALNSVAKLSCSPHSK